VVWGLLGIKHARGGGGYTVIGLVVWELLGIKHAKKVLWCNCKK
jgi:hypothetical protein